MEDIYDLGWAHYCNNLTDQNPYEKGTAECDQYNKGWYDAWDYYNRTDDLDEKLVSYVEGVLKYENNQ